jgi:HD-GYP domain-containing protein (c-di-GMP phosphodiesterase class II)
LEILGRAIVAALQNAESFEQAQRSFLETTAGLIGNIEERYPCMEGHSERVTGLAVKLGQALGLDGDVLQSLRFGALLHDLGQLEQYRELLDRTVILSPSDRMQHRRRTAEQTAHLLGPGGQGAVGEVVRHHQEYWDGTGLPDGLRGTEIPLGARIVALANAWDALIHDRPHRPAYGPESALRIIRDRAGRQFDPGLTDLLSRLMDRVPAGVLAP